MKKTILAILPVLLVASAFQLSTTYKSKPAPIITPDVKNRIDATLKSFTDSGKTAGVSALILRREKKCISMPSGTPTGKQTNLWTAIPWCASSP